MGGFSKHFQHIEQISHGKFDSIIGSLKLASFVLKGDNKWLSPDYTTTIGKTIYLAHNWWSWSFADQCQNLCHEGRHMKQWEKYTAPGFLALYAIPSKRLILEKEAYLETLRFWILSGVLPNFSKMAMPISAARQNKITKSIVESLREGYFMKPNESDLYQWIVDAVAGLYGP